MIDSDYMDYSTKNHLLKHYYNKSINTAIKFLRSVANNGTLILDFGCGPGILKERLPNHNIVGYDVDSRFGDVEDFKTIKPEVIFSHHVLEHLEERELKKVINEFYKMEPKYLILGEPTENMVGRVGRKILKMRTYEEMGHQVNLKTIYSYLENYFDLIEERDVYTLTKVSKWRI